MQKHFDTILAGFSNSVLFTNTTPPTPSLLQTEEPLFTEEPLHFAQSLFNKLVASPCAGEVWVFPCPGLKNDFSETFVLSGEANTVSQELCHHQGCLSWGV